ncbi:MAG: type II secretion system minor pseudopilin GspJ [Alcanivorax sp.]|nr:type II secretion system minor pseudopilin GspJ [Alcanivorax sp.]
MTLTAESSRSRQSGFTLLEVVIAIALFAFMYMAAQLAFSTALDNRDILARHATSQEDRQRALIFLAQDIEQLVARPARDAFGDTQPAVRGTLEQFEFTRLGWANPFDLRQRSQMQRVAYFVDEDQQLIRRHWPAVDQNQGTEPVDTIILGDVEEIRFRFLDRGPQGEWIWRDEWPDVELAQTPPLFQRLPRSIDMELTFLDETSIQRFYRTVVNPWSQP